MEAKDIFEYLGISEADSLDKFKSAFEGKFITRALAHDDEAVAGKITANVLGGLTTEAKRLFGFKGEDVKDKPFKDILKMGVENLTTKIKTLEESTSNDEKYTKLKGEYDALTGKYGQTAEDVVKLRQELDNEKATSANTIKQFKIGHAYEAAKSKLPFADGVTDVTKIGFDTVVKSKYKMDIDDATGNILVMSQDGKRIPNPKRTGEYLGLSEVLDMELDAVEGLKKRNSASGPVRFQQQAQNNNNNQNNNGANNGSKVHPRAVAQVGKLS